MRYDDGIMRTTVDIPEDLLRAAKQKSARSKETLSSLVQQALRKHLEAHTHDSGGRFEVIVAGDPGGRKLSAKEIHKLLDDEWRAPT